MENEGVIEEFYKSIALAWGIAMLWAIGLQQGWIALSISFGVMLGVMLLISLNWMVQRTFVPGSKRAVRVLWIVMLVKYPLYISLVYGLAKWGSFNLPAFCGGLALVYFAIGCKVIGYLITDRSKSPVEGFREK